MRKPQRHRASHLEAGVWPSEASSEMKAAVESPAPELAGTPLAFDANFDFLMRRAQFGSGQRAACQAAHNELGGKNPVDQAG